MKNEFFTVGKITAPHGILGEVKIIPYSKNPSSFREYGYLLIQGKKYEIQNSREHKNVALVKLKGIETMDDALLLKNSEVTIPRELASALDEGEYYISDLLGARLSDEKNHRFGTLKNVLPAGGADVFEFLLDTGESLLVSHRKEYVEAIDIARGEIKMDTSMGIISKGKKK